MPITKEIDRKKNLTVFKITGRAPFDDFRESIIEFYKSGATDLVIFDLRKAEGSGEQFTHERISQLVDFAESVKKGRGKGKTAMVANRDLFFGLGRTVEAYMNISKIEYKTFRNMDEAIEWLEMGKKD